LESALFLGFLHEMSLDLMKIISSFTSSTGFMLMTDPSSASLHFYLMNYLSFF
jgi:hypothetical protein